MNENIISINGMLTEAVRLNKAGKNSDAITLAYKASDKIAVTYLLTITGQQHPEGWEAYDLFDKTLREIGRHPAFLQQIREIAGDAYVLREAYVPELLDETTSQDAQIMINAVAKLFELIKSVSSPN